MKIRDRQHPYLLNLFLACSQVLSALRGYDADCTYSAVMGEKMVEKKVNKLPWLSNPFEAFLQRLLDKIEKDHCRKAYAHEIKFEEFMKNFNTN